MESEKTGPLLPKFNIKIKILKKNSVNNFYEMTCTEDNHNKYYTMKYEEYLTDPPDRLNRNFRVVKTYGKIGTTGKIETQFFHSMDLARDYVFKKIKIQLKKGYKLITN